MRAWDATGANPVTLITFDSDVTNGVTGDNVLVTSANFINDVSPAFSRALRSSTNRDFTLATLTNTIPASYLNAGKLTYEESTGTILWSLAWGGASYSGSTGGTSGLNGSADPGKFAGALPSSGLTALLYQGAAGGANTANATDYAVTSTAAIVRNNSRSSFTVVPEPGAFALILLSAGLWISKRSTKPRRTV